MYVYTQILNSTLSLFTTSQLREKWTRRGEKKIRLGEEDKLYIVVRCRVGAAEEEKAKTSKAPGVAQLLSTLHSALRRHHPSLCLPFFTQRTRFNDSESEIIKTGTRSVMDLMNFTIWKRYSIKINICIHLFKLSYKMQFKKGSTEPQEE